MNIPKGIIFADVSEDDTVDLDSIVIVKDPTGEIHTRFQNTEGVTLDMIKQAFPNVEIERVQL